MFSNLRRPHNRRHPSYYSAHGATEINMNMNIKKISSALSLLALSTALTACGNNQPQPTQETAQLQSNVVALAHEASVPTYWPTTVRLAVTGLEGMEELQRNHEPFRQLLEQKMGVDFEFFALSSRVVSATAMQMGQVDVILAGPSEYVQIKYETPNAQILAAMERQYYHTVFIVKYDSPLQNLQDLVGTTIGMGSVGSTSRHIGPSAMLIEEGFDLDRDFTIHNLGTSGSIAALRGGDVDAIAGGIRDFMSLEAEDGYGVFRILVEGPQLPQDPFVASPDLPQSLRDELSRVLLTYSDAILSAMLESEGEDSNKYAGAAIVTIDDSYFDAIRAAYRALGLEL